MDSTKDENEEASELPEEAAEPKGIQPEQAPAAPEPKEPSHRPRAEEALAAMRADLREQESQELAGGRGLKGLFQRLFRRRRAPSQENSEEVSRLEELQIPEPPLSRMVQPPEPAAEQAPAQESQPAAPAAEEAKPDFQSMVRNRLGDVFAETVQREPLEMEPPAPIQEEDAYGAGPAHSILTTLRKEEEPSQPLPEPVDFRQAALEDYVVATEEPAEEQGPALSRRLKQSWRYMRPNEKRLLIGVLVFLGLILLGGTGYAAIKMTPTPTVAPTPTFDPVPVPISVSLPGGWIRPLSIGDVGADGTWNPTRDEWLRTTVICRWVSLQWTEQLEAVVRTFKANDPIQLSMSNYDNVVYKVQSINQVPASDVSKLCPSGPGLLLILSKDGTNERWVATAKP